MVGHPKKKRGNILGIRQNEKSRGRVIKLGLAIQPKGGTHKGPRSGFQFWAIRLGNLLNRKGEKISLKGKGEGKRSGDQKHGGSGHARPR